MPSVVRIRFAAFELNLETGELWKRGRKLRLPPKPLRLLALLASSPNQLVTRETIQAQIWEDGVFVDFEQGLNFSIRKIRTALGDNAKKPQFIETLPRRGYRFIAEISAEEKPVQRETREDEAYEAYSKARGNFSKVGKETLEQARVDFERALALDPRYALAHSGLGATYSLRTISRRDAGDLDKALFHLQRALELDPELAEPYPWLCYVHMRQNRLEDALQAGHRAVRLQPDLVHAHYFLGLAYFASCESDPSNYQNAATHLLRASRVGPAWQPTTH